MPVLFEYQAVTSKPVADVVTEEIDRSDAVLLLVGHRYGSTDPQTGTSWIEAEYDAANRRAKPLLLLMAADDAQWPPKFIDKDRTRIQRFRQRLVSDLVVHIFRGTEDLRLQIMQSLARFVEAFERPPTETHAKSPNLREVRIVRLLLSSPGDVADETGRPEPCSALINRQLKSGGFSSN
jgi:hypothetical protein